MNIGSCCFTDNEIIGRIISHKKRGVCDITGNKDTYVYDTCVDDYLQGIFNKLIRVYIPANICKESIDKYEKIYIKNDIAKKWNIFKNINTDQVYKILIALSTELYTDEPYLFDEPVVDSSFFNNNFVKENSIIKNVNWDEFVHTLKHKNRFHTNSINLDILYKICTYIRKVYKKGEIFFRGRIVYNKDFNKGEMSAPESNKATAGRANSEGISRLYLSKDKQTVIHELRAGAFDSVTIGEFELINDITVVDLKMLNQISPFIDNLDPRLLIINKEILNKINEEISRPLRKNDSVLDYLPTQYIVDSIQSFMRDGRYEYDGIEYKSTLNGAGVNLAIFYPNMFVCKDLHTYKIEKLKYTYDKSI